MSFTNILKYGLLSQGVTPVFPSSGLTNYWRFEDNCNDAIGSRNGTPTLISYSIGINNKDIYFNSNSAAVSLGNDVFSSANVVSGSISTWIKTSTTPSTSRTYVKFFSMEGWLNIGLGNTTGYPYAVTDGSGANFLIYSQNVTDGNWHNIVVTWNASYTKMYLDGAYVNGKISSNSPLPSSTGGRATRIGNFFNDGQDDDYWGYLDEMGFWGNKELSLSEVQAIWNNGIGTFY